MHYENVVWLFHDWECTQMQSLLTTNYDGRPHSSRVCRMVLSKSTKNRLDSTVDLQADEEIDSNC